MSGECKAKSGLDEGSLPGRIICLSAIFRIYQNPKGGVSGGNFIYWGFVSKNSSGVPKDFGVDSQITFGLLSWRVSQLLETFNSGVNAVEGYSDTSAGGEEGEPQHDTAIYWFSCTHKRQVCYMRL